MTHRLALHKLYRALTSLFLHKVLITIICFYTSKWTKIRNYFSYWLQPAQPTQKSSGRLKKFTTSYDQTRRRHDVWKMTLDLRRLEDVWFTSSWRRRIYDVLKTSDLRRLEMSNLGRLENVWFTSSSGCLIYDVLKTSDLRCLEDVQLTISWRRLTYDVLKTSDLWCLEDVCKATFV